MRQQKHKFSRWFKTINQNNLCGIENYGFGFGFVVHIIDFKGVPKWEKESEVFSNVNFNISL